MWWITRKGAGDMAITPAMEFLLEGFEEEGIPRGSYSLDGIAVEAKPSGVDASRPAFRKQSDVVAVSHVTGISWGETSQAERRGEMLSDELDGRDRVVQWAERKPDDEDLAGADRLIAMKRRECYVVGQSLPDLAGEDFLESHGGSSRTLAPLAGFRAALEFAEFRKDHLGVVPQGVRAKGKHWLVIGPGFVPNFDEPVSGTPDLAFR